MNINFNFIAIIDLNLKYILSNKIIIYKNKKIFNTLNIIVTEFENIFINSKNIIDLLEE